ncbi:hypothetical protein [Oceanobacillus kimchii]|uniref:Uncharacterized protein n=1 Tax=Oceanobacillus kimchii TaxID=746691 RepID=A0ABQ5TIZ7_9BACI|nr:hypothetical protein [Oceanobacillus kimchii]GLO66256.1 hypothetical protein MACH08_20400 [Oceanobacillus kimchii]
MNLEKNMEEVGRVTQESGRVLSNAMKSIQSRVLIEDVRKYLTSKGINTQGNCSKSILDSLADYWKSMSQEEKEEVAIVVAGHYQLVRFFAMMENYQK